MLYKEPFVLYKALAYPALNLAHVLSSRTLLSVTCGGVMLFCCPEPPLLHDTTVKPSNR